MLIGLTREFAVAAAIACTLATTAHAAFTISNADTKNVQCTSGVCMNTRGNANLNTSELQTMLVSSDVTVKSHVAAFDIGILDPLMWASSHRLTLDAKKSIHVRAPVVVEGAGGVTLITAVPRNGGEYHFNTTTSGSLTFWDTSSSLIINRANYTLVKDIKTLSSDIAANPSGNYALAGNYDATADGLYAQSPIDVTFNGAFEGLGNTISNLTINDPAPSVGDGIGLFRFVDTGGSLRDVNLKNVSIYAGGSQIDVGGLAGAMEDATVSAASVSGSVVAGYGATSGGLIGYAQGTGRNVISNSHAAVSVHAGENSFAGGLIGALIGEATGSWATGSVSIGRSYELEPPASAGGLVGYAFTAELLTTITNCYATGAVSGKSFTNAGGLIGVSFGSVPISTSYASGPVHAGHKGAEGGFIGFLYVLYEADDYWNITTSGLTDGVGNRGNIDGVTGLTDAQLKAGLPAGFDPAVWGQSAGINNGWPYLLANPPPQ